MTQEYIVNDIVMYDNKIMVVKEPRDGIHFDLSCPKEGLVYCFVSIVDIVPIPITHKILCKNGWKANAIKYDYSIKDKLYFRAFTDYKTGGVVLEVYTNMLHLIAMMYAKMIFILWIFHTFINSSIFYLV